MGRFEYKTDLPLPSLAQTSATRIKAGGITDLFTDMHANAPLNAYHIHPSSPAAAKQALKRLMEKYGDERYGFIIEPIPGEGKNKNFTRVYKVDPSDERAYNPNGRR